MHTADTLTLRPKELDRLTLITRIHSGELTQREGARLLGLSERHLRRLIRCYEHQGAKGIKNKRIGKPASNRLPDRLKDTALKLIKEHFYDYGPTLAAEKLAEYFGIKASKETVRQWMIRECLWHPKQKKAPRIHPPRARRPLLGELIQVDGSYHHWFEDRGPKCCLLVFIDDATSRLMKIKFTTAETTIDYIDTFKEYVLEHGAPRALYFDKHNVFHINQRTAKAQNGITQFGRILKSLNIKPIYAHSPQAKGRVERVNATLQDRLIKEMRFFQINDINSANQFLKGFVERFNLRFSKAPEIEENGHRKLTLNEINHLNFTFSIHTLRTISKDLTIRHNKQLIKIIPATNKARQLVLKKVTICETLNGMNIYLNGNPLEFAIKTICPLAGPTLNRKTLDHYLDQAKRLEKYWQLVT